MDAGDELRFTGFKDLRQWVEERLGEEESGRWKARGFRDHWEFTSAVADAISWADGFDWNRDARPAIAAIPAHEERNDPASVLDMTQR